LAPVRKFGANELSCSICLNIYTEPVSLPCGHYFCQDCIGGLLDTQEQVRDYSSERFLSTHPEVELLSEASEKKKEKLRKVLEKLSPEREETEREAQRLQERRGELEEKAAIETERVTALFRGIREELEALEKRLLSDISRQKEELTLTLTELIQQLEIKKDELALYPPIQGLVDAPIEAKH
uniref:RING-type domain-containing protein n=1 Tax=Xenopus tropicalis TaxID=8364 RepID=A0A6I8SXH4_XENTR